MTFAITNTFTNGTLADADEVNANFQDVVDELNGVTNTSLVICPVGSVVAWLKSFTNTPALPAGWAECNGQVLSDAGSVYNGQTLPSLNSTNYFLRGNATSGSTGGSATLSDKRLNSAQSESRRMDTSGDGYVKYEGSGTYSAGLSDTVEDLAISPPYYNIVWIIRIK